MTCLQLQKTALAVPQATCGLAVDFLQLLLDSVSSSATMADSHHKTEFYPTKVCSRKQEGGAVVFYKAFGDKVKAAIKDPSCADKHLRFFVKKAMLQQLDIPSLGARDVLVVPAKEQVCC